MRAATTRRHLTQRKEDLADRFALRIYLPRRLITNSNTKNERTRPNGRSTRQEGFQGVQPRFHRRREIYRHKRARPGSLRHCLVSSSSNGKNVADVDSAATNGQTQEGVAIKKVTNVFSKKILAKRALREIKLLQHFRGHRNVCQVYYELGGRH